MAAALLGKGPGGGQQGHQQGQHAAGFVHFIYTVYILLVFTRAGIGTIFNAAPACDNPTRLL